MTKKAKRVQPGDIVELVWRDAYSPVNQWWTSVDNVSQDMEQLESRMRACGYFVSKNKKYICLAMAWDFDKDKYEVGKILYIPSSEILQIRKV